MLIIPLLISSLVITSWRIYAQKFNIFYWLRLPENIDVQISGILLIFAIIRFIKYKIIPHLNPNYFTAIMHDEKTNNFLFKEYQLGLRFLNYYLSFLENNI